MQFFAILVFSMLTATIALGQTAPPATQPSTDQVSLEKKLEETLSNATLTGHFTVDGAADGPSREDHYTLGPVKKLAGDSWLISARIGRSATMIPLVLPIKWAGDTPIIMVTDFGIPGMHKYTARVVIYADHYAGFWSAGPDHQGTLYGKIEHPPATQPAQTPQ